MAKKKKKKIGGNPEARRPWKLFKNKGKRPWIIMPTPAIEMWTLSVLLTFHVLWLRHWPRGDSFLCLLTVLSLRHNFEALVSLEPGVRSHPCYWVMGSGRRVRSLRPSPGPVCPPRTVSTESLGEHQCEPLSLLHLDPVMTRACVWSYGCSELVVRPVVTEPFFLL